MAYIFFINFIFVQATRRIVKLSLGRRLGFDLKQCLIDIIGRFWNNETRIMIYNFNFRGLILKKLVLSMCKFVYIFKIIER